MLHSHELLKQRAVLSLSTLAHQCISCSHIYQLPAQVMLVFWMCLSLCQTGSRETTCLASQAGAVIELGLVKQEKKKKKKRRKAKGLNTVFEEIMQKVEHMKFAT